jgi:hypothetical protein
LSGATGATHCPSCLTEHRAGFTICTVCGTLLVDGPSPTPDREEDRQPARGSLEFGDRGEIAETADRFALEETPVVLTAIVEEDVSDFLAALEEQEIGARTGSATDDGGVEIAVHAANLADAQAVLVEFTGDVRLVDEIGGDDEDVEMLVVTTARLADAGGLAARLRAEGLDVRIELPSPEDAAGGSSAAILVRADELARARELLGLVA